LKLNLQAVSKQEISDERPTNNTEHAVINGLRRFVAQE